MIGHLVTVDRDLHNGTVRVVLELDGPPALEIGDRIELKAAKCEHPNRSWSKRVRRLPGGALHIRYGWNCPGKDLGGCGGGYDADWLPFDTVPPDVRRELGIP